MNQLTKIIIIFKGLLKSFHKEWGPIHEHTIICHIWNMITVFVCVFLTGLKLMVLPWENVNRTCMHESKFSNIWTGTSGDFY